MNFEGRWIWPAVLAMASAGVAGGLLRSQYERNHFVEEETLIVSPKVKRPRKLVFLSDLHDKEFGAANEQLLKAIAGIRPDAVLIGGDTMVVKPGKASLEVTERLLDGLCRLEGKPAILYGDGNHEQRMQWEQAQYGTLYTEFREMLAARGILYLHDQTAMLGEDLAVSGLEIEKSYYRDFAPNCMSAEYVREHLGMPDSDRFQILMAHSPLFMKAYDGWGADLSLAGHFHGGTIRLPGLGGVMTPQFQFFLSVCSGEFEQDGHHMIVSRGLGTHSINIRFNNRPQVVVIRLEPDAARSVTL